MLLSFYLKGDREEVQAQLVTTCHCKSSLVQVELVIVGEVNAIVSATIKNHMQFYKYLELVKSLHIQPKEDNI